MGQSVQFWKDKKDVWVDPRACQNADSDDELVDVSKSSTVPSNRDDTGSSSDCWNVNDRFDTY